MASTTTPAALGYVISSQSSVLIVDDQERLRQLLKAVLLREGYEVQTAASGQEALRLLEMKAPDVILLDVRMPHESGLTLCSTFKQHPAAHDVPVIFLSGMADLNTVVEGFQAGGIDFIQKPFRKSDLLARVAAHAQQHRQHRMEQIQTRETCQGLRDIGQSWHRSMGRVMQVTERLAQSSAVLQHPQMAAYLQETQGQLQRMLAELEHALKGAPLVQAEDRLAHTVLSTVDLKHMVQRWYISAQRKRLELLIHTPRQPREFHGDMILTAEMVDAVLNNAIHYAPNESRVIVHISSKGGRVHLMVEDEGPGFPPNYLARPFHPYAKARLSQDSSGLGVGLATAHRAAVRMGASLNLSNRQPRGAMVTISFSPAPIATDGARETAASKANMIQLHTLSQSLQYLDVMGHETAATLKETAHAPA